MKKEMKKEILENLNNLIKIKEVLEKLKKVEDIVEKDSDCDSESDCDEASECEHFLSLKKDYDAFFIWCVGEDFENVGNWKKALKKWKQLHPNLSIPRVFLTEESLPQDLVSLGLFIDAYPLYLNEEKRRKQNENI